MLAKLVPYMIISFIDMVIILCISYFEMYVPMAGSLIVYYYCPLNFRRQYKERTDSICRSRSF